MSPRGGQARAFALRRQRDRHTPLTDDGHLRDQPTPAKVTHDQAEQYERLRQAAEALGQLKPQEIRALQLKAEGYSYREICQLTGWTFTKTSFCLFCLRKGRAHHAAWRAGLRIGCCAKRTLPNRSGASLDGCVRVALSELEKDLVLRV